MLTYYKCSIWTPAIRPNCHQYRDMLSLFSEVSECLICTRQWVLSMWLLYFCQQVHPLVWWMATLESHLTICHAAPWCAAISVAGVVRATLMMKPQLKIYSRSEMIRDQYPTNACYKFIEIFNGWDCQNMFLELQCLMWHLISNQCAWEYECLNRHSYPVPTVCAWHCLSKCERTGAFNICKHITRQGQPVTCDIIGWYNAYNYCWAHFFYSGRLVPLSALCMLEHMTAIKSLEASSLPSMSIVKHDRRWAGKLSRGTYSSYCIITMHVLNLESNSTEMLIIYGKKYFVHDWGVTLSIAELLFTYVKM